MWREVMLSIRAWLATLGVCAVLYPLCILAFGWVVVPERAKGSMLRDGTGQIIGSRLIAQSFARPEYLWPRPSAVDYDAAATGGSNLAPNNPDLTARAAKTLERFEGAVEHLVPADLVAASGSGVDPHITLDAALYQVPRIAQARGVSASRIEEVLRRNAIAPPWSPLLVNVLETNIALDDALGKPT